MRRTRVKFCGITRPTDAHAAVALGADALGFNFWPGSPRFIAPAAAGEIARQLPPFVTLVGLFVNQSPDDINAAMAASGLGLVQLHGDEPAELCRSLARPYIKAVRMREDTSLESICASYADAAAILADTYVAGVAGGTGQTFDWGRLPASAAKPLILAGGLTADNVASAITKVRPFAVDVSGGIEQAKGIKDAGLMSRFMHEVRKVDYE
ncbi:MAG: phosphoribosylanthranilate isomerase [Gammaproteobacteria bacterium]|nr:phosphoribosylanthranilate isomerase [Gammaproteobacteria bacterium]